MYPFLDRDEFETRASASISAAGHINELAWTALYHTVLALGCEFDDGGSFTPGEGEAWGLFKVALDLYPRILLLNTDLLEVQVRNTYADVFFFISFLVLHQSHLPALTLPSRSQPW